MERSIGEDPFYQGISRLIKDPASLNAKTIVLNGNINKPCMDLGVLAIFPSIHDPESYEQVFYYQGEVGELQSVVKAVKKPDRFEDLPDWSDPVLTLKMVEYSRKNSIPLAVLVVKRPEVAPNDAQMTLYCLKGFNPKVIYNTFRQDCILYISELQ